MIQEIPIAQLDPRQVKQLETAEAAVQTNLSYTLEVYSSILKQSQGCIELRKKLRALQIKSLQGSTKGLNNLLGKVTSVPFMFGSKGEKDPEGTLIKAEGLIEKNPGNVLAHEMLADAATHLEMKETVVFAYETIRKIHPTNIKNLKELGNAYLEFGNTEKAIETGNSILKVNPTDGDAVDLMKRASVAVAMNKGKWEESEDFRSQLKDESEAQALEQQSKSITDSKGLEDLIRQSYEKLEQEPSNLNNYRQLSEYYHRYGDLENSIAWIQEARKQEAGQGDVSLEEKERQLTLEYFDNSIEEWEKLLATKPNDEETIQSRDNAITQKKLYEKNQLESLVQRYPNDYGYRYELGINLFNNEDYDNCLSHFQLAQRNAKVRLDAILYLGRAYSRKNFYDLAIEQFSILKNEIQIMDERKKDAIYELGCCFELMGDQDKAIEEFKVVYSADISFRDVADKINAFYSRNK
ncbi:MAG: tetratricopeptide repeat protein [Opitutales bacterium]|nr:tetratricopeptide repeat protein [Opitutales bacterium]